jgi:hypothetical protein
LYANVGHRFVFNAEELAANIMLAKIEFLDGDKKYAIKMKD